MNMSTHLILLADDEPHITHIISHKLTRAGYEVVTAEDGEVAFKTALEQKPSAIVTDLQMPYLSGIELAQQLAANETTKDIPIIMLTARGYTVEEEIAKLPSVKKLLSKPFSAKDLLKDINALLADDAEGMAA
jgi:DNA-binding response OmpR family regulator